MLLRTELQLHRPVEAVERLGVGVVQEELNRAVNDDPAVIALGVAEAWNCAHPEAIRKALGWAAHTGERNGITLLARYGFAGTPEWFQLDTSLNTNPSDTKWVVRAPVCADAACSRSIQVFSSHWSASGETRTESFERQAHGTIAFMDRLPATEPRVLVGDLNVWEEGGVVCSQSPVPTAVQILRDAGNLDAWPSIHGTAEGYTGMWNRNGCGDPNGYLWKRIDHGWSKSLPAPLSMARFGMVTPGACAPSDHAGIIVEYAWPGGDTTAPTIGVTAPAAGTVVTGATLLAATASDGIGVTAVGFTVDGVLVGTDTTAPYEMWWDSTAVANGSHTVAAWAEDAAGNRGIASSVGITVDNPPADSLDFSLSATPSSRRVNAGAKTSYTVSTRVISESPAAVSLNVTGLPSGATATFDPESIVGSGSSTLTIATSSSTAGDIYALTITGVSGSVLRTTSVSLSVVVRKR